MGNKSSSAHKSSLSSSDFDLHKIPADVLEGFVLAKVLRAPFTHTRTTL